MIVVLKLQFCVSSYVSLSSDNTVPGRVLQHICFFTFIVFTISEISFIIYIAHTSLERIFHSVFLDKGTNIVCIYVM